uniref:POTRA domain-containing protein n=1 Tax=Acrosorium ciliolatum TaxID=1550622 RepID=A0A1Z1M2A4_9FLOR|nr:hypothetical protein [Acrosorium ciliolatum]ARW59981.1 hypothetical protein [Acrosorium ciliolatum]
MINYYLQNFFSPYIYKVHANNTIYTAFHIYFISNNTNFYSSNHKHLKKIIILNILNKKTKNIINNSFNKFYKNKYNFNNFINKTFFYRIKYNQKNKIKLKYIIFYIKCNPILKKIEVNNYNQLKISKNILNNLFKNQIGLPLNYLDIKYSLNKIHDWYISNGYKWIKIEYLYKNNVIQLQIYEGVINDIIFINNLDKKISNTTFKILTTNIRIKNEFLIFTRKPINFYDLELKIHEIKNKYLIKELRYQLEYKSKKLILIIEYNLKNNNRIQFRENIVIKDLKNQLILYKLYFQNIQNKNNFRFTYLRTNRLYINSIFVLITLFNKYYIYKLILKNKIIYLYLQQIQNYSFISFIYFQNFLLKSLISNYSSNDFDLLFKHKFFSYRKINPYSYFVNLIKLETHLKLKIFKDLIVIKKIINEYKFNYEKNCLLSNYINNIKFKKIEKIKYIYLLNSKIELKYNYLSLILKQNQKITDKIYLDYNKIIYLNSNKLNIFHKFKNYIQIIRIKYYKYYKLPYIFYKDNIIIFFIELYTVKGYLSKYSLLKNYYLKKYENILIHIEYKFYGIKYNYIYTFITYLPSSINHINYLINSLNINYDQYSNIRSGLGIQFKIPIKYIPSIRLELHTKNYKKFFFYFYKTSLLYK